MFEKNTIYIVGNSKVQQNNPIAMNFGQFFIGFVVEKTGGRIITCEASTTISLTAKFIDNIFSGMSMEEPFDVFAKEVESRYFGSSSKAILVAFRDAQKKYANVKRGISIEG